MLPTFVQLLAASLVIVPAALAGVSKPPIEQPPFVKRFHPDQPVQQDRGVSANGGGRSTLLYRRSIDVTGILSNTLVDRIDPGVPPANTVLDLLFPPGAVVHGFAYNAAFTYSGGPANPGMGFRFFNQINEEIVETINPGASPAALTALDTDVGSADWLTLPNGHLRVEFFEAVDDVLNPVQDGVWTSGQIEVLYELGSGVECCTWDNGAFDNRDGALSQDSPVRVPPVFHVMADDFYLEPNYVHMIEYMEAVFLTLFPAPQYAFDVPIGRLEVRTDCDGKPGELLATHDIILQQDSFLGEISTDLGIANVYRVIALTDGLCLPGGKSYWASFILTGINTQNGTDLWYWGTTGSPSIMPPYAPPLHVKGSLPHRQAAMGGPWERIDCATNDPNCLGCTDLNFCIRGERCKIIYDAGTYKEPLQPAGTVINQFGARSVNISGVTARQARAADDVTISPCETSLFPCVVEAYVWTTCTPPTARLEIYETECADDTVRPAVTPLNFSIVAGQDDAVYQGFEIPATSGPPFRLYCFKFKDFDGFVFEPGKTYWLAAMGTGDAGLNNDAYFALSAPKCPEDLCYRLGSEGHARSAFAGSTYPTWTPTSLVPGLLEPNDFAMLVAVRNGPSTLNSGNAVQCRADFDRSGQVAVADIFSFLSEWFSGCP